MKVRIKTTCEVTYDLPIDDSSKNGTFAMEKRYIEKTMPFLVKTCFIYIVKNYIIDWAEGEKPKVKTKIVFDKVKE